jgi:hypothetical protein
MDQGAQWEFRCTCGKTKALSGSQVSLGIVKSCGCLCAEKKRKHGYYRTPTYASWQAMIERCEREKHPHFARYGGRGISVCPRWRGSFQFFLDDVGERPAGKTLDRFPNKDGNYEPGNTRWATDIEQHQNMRNNRYLTHGGETRLLIDWSKISGIKPSTIRERIRRGWSIELTLTTPARPISNTPLDTSKV